MTMGMKLNQPNALIARSDLSAIAEMIPMNAKILDLGCGFLDIGIILQNHPETVPQVGSFHAGECIILLMVLHKPLQRLFPGNKIRLKNVFDHIDLGADALGLCLCEAAVHISQDLIGLIQFLHHDIDIVHQNGEAAHDQQTCHRDTHSGEGHEAVEENTPDALFQ